MKDITLSILIYCGMEFYITNLQYLEYFLFDQSLFAFLQKWIDCKYIGSKNKEERLNRHDMIMQNRFNANKKV